MESRKATPEEASRSNTEAKALLEKLWPMNLPAAIEWLRANPPSPEAVASLAWIAHNAIAQLKQQQRGKMNKKPVTDDQLRAVAEERGWKKGWKKVAAKRFGISVRGITNRGL